MNSEVLGVNFYYLHMIYKIELMDAEEHRHGRF